MEEYLFVKCLTVFILAALELNGGVSGSLPVVFPVETWPACTISGSHQGTCERVVHCPQAVSAIYRGLHPPACYWERYQTFPLVCCPHQGNLDDVLQQDVIPSSPETPITSDQEQPACGRLEESQTDSTAGYNHVWPWMVSIFKEGEGEIQVGSGFLIDDKHVLSAAQNFPSPPKRDGWVVKLERPKRDTTGTANLASVYTVKDIKIHEGFRSWVRYDDLALVTLEDPVKNAQPVCLPTSSFDPSTLAGVNATVLGAHREEQVPIVSSSWCSEMYAKFVPLSYPRGLHGEFFCAGLQLNEQPDPPNIDDMGGPVMTQTKDGTWMAIGLVSLDYKCTEQGLPGVYLNLANYKDWIDEQRAAPQ